MTPVRPQDLVERALAASRSDGCIAIATVGSGANLRWANNTLTTNGVADTRDLTVIAVAERSDGVATGVVARSGVAVDDVDDLVAEAEAIAATDAPADDAAPLAPGRTSADWDDPPATTSTTVFSGVAPALGEAFGAARSGGRSLYGYAELDVDTAYVGSSSGLRLRHSQPTGRLELTGRSPDGTRSAWVGHATRDFSDVDVLASADELAQRLAWAERRVDLPAGRYETLLPPSAVADLMVYVYWESGALDAHEGRTVFSKPGGGTRVGERLSPLPVSLRSDPTAAGLECASHVVTTASSRLSSVFDNGLECGAVDWIRDGELSALLQTRHSAEVTGLPFTPWVDNLMLRADGEGRSLEQMVASTERGLLLTCLWYIREVDPQTLLVTGLTRDGVYLVEGGEVVGAVNNFRFNESPVGMLGRLTEVGASVQTLAREFGDYFTRTSMPSLRVGDFNMSTVSKAF
jgi:predicted Zn-dependent protease